MKASSRIVLLILLILMLVFSAVSVAFADSPYDPSEVCDPDPKLPPFGEKQARCQWQLSEVAPAGPLGPLGP